MNFFSSIVLLACLCISSITCLTEEMQEVLDMLHNTCKEQTGADEDVLQRANKGDFADDDKLRCYIKCVMSEMSILSDDGQVDSDAAYALMPPDLQPTLGAAMLKCGTQAGSDVCDTAYRTFKCYFDNAPKDYFLP